MGHDTLPSYTPSAPPPQYSSGVLPGEQSVEYTHRTPSRRLAGVYRRITDQLTIVLRDQHPGSVYPIYGPRGTIRGDVILDNVTGDLTSVILKLEGQVLLHTSRVPMSSIILSDTYVLWNAPQATPCPRTIPFAIVFPRAFDDGVSVKAPPPTLESIEPPASCSYSLTVELSRPRQLLSFSKGSYVVRVPFVYRPRSCPRLPVLHSDLPFMSTVKSSPEEWYEIMCTMPMSRGSGLAAVECLLFIPSVRTYAFSDIIPFHLQIRGSPAALIPFVVQSKDGSQDSTRQQNGGVVIRVYLLRQFSVRIHGQSAAVGRNLGEGHLKPSHSLPSRHHTCLRHPLGEGLNTLDWDGVLVCSEDVTIPSFSTKQVSVEDSVVLSVTPRQPLKSPVLGVTHRSPIRLATDPWSNDGPLLSLT